MINRWQVPRRASQEDTVSKELVAGDKIVFGLPMGQRR
jgi:hypothetical protein